jgi:glycosyltransferase involved in cell wall biosynthesis
MNICLIGSSDSVHIKKWSAYFAARGHDVSVLSNSRTPIEGVRTVVLFEKRKFGNLAYLLSLPRVRKTLRALNPDIVHFHYLGGVSLYGLVAKGPVILATPWGSDIYRLKNRLMKKVIARLFRKSAEILTTSTPMAAFLQKNFAVDREKISTYSWGIETRLFTPAAPDEKARLREGLNIPESAFLIFSNRTMAPMYKTDLILRAFLESEGRLDHPFLVLLEGDADVGEGIRKYRDSIRTMSAGKDNIRILPGLIPTEVMAEYLRAADVAISIPSSDQRSSSVLEALASGPSVILSGLPPYQELKKEGYQVSLIERLSEQSLVQAFLESHSLPSSAKQDIQKKNLVLIRESEDWLTQAAKIETRYAFLLKRRSI